MIPQTFIDDLLARADIVETINTRVPLKRKGSEYAACCPFHNEKTPSFYVSPAKQFYHCFGCGAHGTALGFLMEHDRLSFPEAVEELARSAGVEVPHEGESGGQDLRPLHDLLAEAAGFYRQALKEGSEAVAYLKGRGLTGEIAREFGVGYAPEGRDILVRAMAGKAGAERLVEAGMAVRRDDGSLIDRFRGRIMFPIRDPRGRVTGFGGRLLGPGEPKYLNSPETPVFHKGGQVYGLYEARKAGRMEEVFVVEGYMDVIALAQNGIRNAVATLGTATTREHIERLFRVVPRIVFCFDGDRAGRQAADRALAHLLPELRDGREARFLFLPEGDDPDTLVRREGASGFRARAVEAVAATDLFLRDLSGRFDTATREGRARLVAEAAGQVRAMPDGLLRDQVLADLARLAGASPERLAREMRAERPAATALPESRSRQGGREGMRLAVTPVRRALALVIQHPELACGLPDCRPLAEIDQPGIPLLVEVLETLKETPDLTVAGLIERFRGREEAEILSRLAVWRPPADEGGGPEKAFSDTLRHLWRVRDEIRTEGLLAATHTRPLTEGEKAELRMLLTGKQAGTGD